MRSALALSAALVALAACEQPAPAAPPPADAAAPEQAPSAARTAPLPSAATPEQLAAILPSQVGDLRRTAVTSDADSAMGLTVSRARATYGTGPQAVTLLVVDVGSAEGARLMGLGVPPTGRLKGLPVHRTQTATSASVQMQVNGRYVVEASGNRVALDLLDVFVQTIAVAPLPG